MIRWLVTGAGGQLGTHLLDRLRADSADVVGLTRAEFDVTDAQTVRETIATLRPDVVVNAAGYTAVDAAEEDEATADLVNGRAPGMLAHALAREGGRLIHISTDYVFAGTARTPYRPSDPVAPRSAYGRTKLAGERAVRAALPDRSYVVRTAWVYGGPGPNFVDTMLRLEKQRPTVNVVDDQIGSPTWVADLAGGLVELGRRRTPAGTLHYVNAGTASWYQLAQEVFRLAGADPDRVIAVDSAAFPRPAPRPMWSVLSTRAWSDSGLSEPRHWQAALADALIEKIG